MPGPIPRWAAAMCSCLGCERRQNQARSARYTLSLSRLYFFSGGNRGILVIVLLVAMIIVIITAARTHRIENQPQNPHLPLIEEFQSRARNSRRGKFGANDEQHPIEMGRQACHIIG